MAEMRNQSSLKNWEASFFTIWIGQALSLLGSNIAQFALIWWLTDLSGSATVLSFASLVGLVPGIVLGPIAGAYVDRWNRRRVMIVADTLIALASLWLAYLFWIDAIQIWHVYVILFFRAIGGSFHSPAMSASTSLMVPKEQLTRVAGMNQTLHGLLNVFGAPLGALAMELLPLHGVMMIDVGTAALAIAPLFWVHVPQPQRQESSQKKSQKQSIWADIRDGAQYIWHWPGLVVLTAAAMIFKVVLTPAFSLIPLLVKGHFDGGAAQLSLLEAIIGGGVVAGGVLLSVWGGFGKKIYTIILGGLGFAVAILFWGILPGHLFWAALVSGACLGLTLPLVDGPLMAILQSTVAPEMQGRVFTLFGSLIWITSPLGLALAGPISDWLGLQILYVVAGILTGSTTLLFLFVPAIRNIEENAQGGESKLDQLELVEVEA
ncbi:MAG: MFS transporter [Anaerolineae bacterium]|nr:MFS transporter [Anaerolineae bacterium]